MSGCNFLDPYSAPYYALHVYEIGAYISAGVGVGVGARVGVTSLGLRVGISNTVYYKVFTSDVNPYLNVLVITTILIMIHKPKRYHQIFFKFD